MVRVFFKVVFLLLLTAGAYAQQGGVKQIVTQLEKHNQAWPLEKAHITFDKSYYAAGDTVWFKVYLLNATLFPSKSKKVYVELLNDSSKLVERLVIPVTAGIGTGDFKLEANLPQGSYIVRAYTKFQENFGEAYFFYKSFSIGKPLYKSWLVKVNQTVSLKGTDRNVSMAIQLSGLNNEAIGTKALDVALMDGKKSILRTTLQTDARGIINPVFDLKEEIIGSDMYLLLQDKTDKAQKLIVPIKLSSATGLDMQFMPEGGYMLAGQFGKVGFKAIGEDGLGINITGAILNSKKEQVTKFESLHKGMGHFFLMPTVGETYTAVVDLPDGNKKSFDLPIARQSGTSLRINATANPDSIYLYVRATQDKWTDQLYALLAQNGGESVYASDISLKNGFYNLKVARSAFPQGITHFTLFSPERTPINERNVMVSMPEQLEIIIDPVKENYATLDNIALRLNVKAAGKPSTGSYSISVTDDRQVKQLPDEQSLLSNMLLSSELKGYVEQPAWYFQQDKGQNEALDNLLLTQGWVGYDWKTIMAPLKMPEIPAENDNAISGSVTNLLDKPISNIKLNMLSLGKTLFFADAKSDSLGRFSFEDVPLTDSSAYAIKIKTAKGKASTGNINVAEFTPTKAPLPAMLRKIPWYVNADSSMLKYIRITAERNNEALNPKLDGKAIKEVEIVGKSTMKREKGMTWDATLKVNIDEKTLLETPRTTLHDLLRIKVKGFTTSRSWEVQGNGSSKILSHDFFAYVAGTKRIADVIIDGISTKIPAGFFGVNKETGAFEDTEEHTSDPDYQQYNNALFNFISAEDVKDIKMYQSHIYSFLIIKTRSGSGPFMRKTIGMYVYRPLPVHIARTFYSPKYAVKNLTEPDNRATIFWEPNIFPDANGDAVASFYAADKPTTYTIKVEGTNLGGKFGAATKTIKILDKPIIKMGATPLKGAFEAYQAAFPEEKVYLSLDKPYYVAGDTLWFKGYLLNTELEASKVSDKLHLELYNDSAKLVDERVVVLNNGLAYGDFNLKNNLSNGTYTLRAYTSWQQNFGHDYFFQKTFYIGNTSNKTWLIDANQKLEKVGNKQYLDLKLRLSNLKNEFAGFKDLALTFSDGVKNMSSISLKTTSDGRITTRLPLPDVAAGKYTLRIVDKKEPSRFAVLPLISPDSLLDLQFMPEGGYLVNGLKTRVAFKALGGDGLGQAFTGKIVNNKNETIAAIAAAYNGMGSFTFQPKKGESYSVVYMLNGKEQILPIKNIQDEGIALSIDHLSKQDAVTIEIDATNAMRLNQDYQLIAKAEGKILMATNVNLKQSIFKTTLPKDLFPDGVIHFTLFSPTQEPLNERIAFINQNKKIYLNFKTHATTYTPRDSVNYTLSAKDENGLPVTGSFSLSVTDDNQVKTNNKAGNITTYFLLQSHLKGTIENVGHYFENTLPETLEALDNLLLTQGWVGYNWVNILGKPTAPAFKAELGNNVNGQLTNMFNKPVPNIRLTLLSLGRGLFGLDTLSNGEGKFTFNQLPLIDTPQYLIKTKTVKGKASSATISVDEFLPAGPIKLGKTIYPWYVNADSTYLRNSNAAQKRTQLAEEAALKLAGTAIKEVEIFGSQEVMSNLGWDAKLFEKFTEEQLEKMPHKSLADLLKERIPGFKVSYDWNSCIGRLEHHINEEYVIGPSRITLIRFDKISTTVYSGPEPPPNPVDKRTALYKAHNYLFRNFNAEDVKEISVYKGCGEYYLDITTRGGKGPWLNRAEGVYVYRPKPVLVSKDFYSPKYVANQPSALPDLRATIYWNANLVTDERGIATGSFYTADATGNYSVKLEGTDMQGKFGVGNAKIKITKAKVASK